MAIDGEAGSKGARGNHQFRLLHPPRGAHRTIRNPLPCRRTSPVTSPSSTSSSASNPLSSPKSSATYTPRIPPSPLPSDRPSSLVSSAVYVEEAPNDTIVPHWEREPPRRAPPNYLYVGGGHLVPGALMKASRRLFCNPPISCGRLGDDLLADVKWNWLPHPPHPLP